MKVAEFSHLNQETALNCANRSRTQLQAEQTQGGENCKLEHCASAETDS